LHSAGPQLESAWFQPLIHKRDFTVSKACFQIQLVPLHHGVSLVVNATRRLTGALVQATREEEAKVAAGGGALSAAGAEAAAATAKAGAAARARALRMLNVCVGALWEFATQESQEIKVSLGPGRGVVRLRPRARLGGAVYTSCIQCDPCRLKAPGFNP
jgi:hypothetical protein